MDEQKLCECGCGTAIPPTNHYVRGHHWRVKRREQGVPDEKVCERCDETYRRADLAFPQSNKHWLGRKYCGQACHDEALAELARSQRGESHPGWKGDEATPNSARHRCRQIYPEAQPCEVCGEKAERHHKDGNPRNNVPANIAWLCRTHHIRAEDRMAYRRVVDTPERQARKRAQAAERQRRYQARKRSLGTGG